MAFGNAYTLATHTHAHENEIYPPLYEDSEPWPEHSRDTFLARNMTSINI